MSEISNTIQQRAQILAKFMIELSQNKNGSELVKKYEILNINFIPKDIPPAFDLFMNEIEDLQTVKIISNKTFNLLYKILKSYPALEPKKKSLLYFIKEDNNLIEKKLQELRSIQRQFVQTKNFSLLKQIKDKFQNLTNLKYHYSLLQNIIFPLAEQHWENHKCLSLLWYIQDLVINKIKTILNILSQNQFNEKLFHKTSAEIFFDTYTLIFRENYVLIPLLLETVDNEKIDSLLQNENQIKLSFTQLPTELFNKKTNNSYSNSNLVDLITGHLTPEQIKLIFSHLPIDITYVDENDKVVFFSDSKDRAFPRTKVILGRKVQNCHPPDSVHIVNEILQQFRLGNKNKASFWIHFKDKYLLIQYFAVRDEQGNYKGVLEVTQDIANIQKISGEKRLLDWEN